MDGHAPYVQAERSLQSEYLWRLKAYPVLPLVTPNGIYFPCRDAAERRLRARIINRMKAEGMLIPGMSDLVLMWAEGAALIETKRPAFRDLFGYHPPGTPSEDQVAFAQRAAALNINHAYCDTWPKLQNQLLDWGVEPPEQYFARQR
jgi:hypothetical protein